jgi:ribosome recycling factor
MRQVRHDVQHDLKAKEKAHELPEDDVRRLGAELQKLTDRYIGMIDDLLKKKTAEVMEV